MSVRQVGTVCGKGGSTGELVVVAVLNGEHYNTGDGDQRKKSCPTQNKNV